MTPQDKAYNKIDQWANRQRQLEETIGIKNLNNRSQIKRTGPKLYREQISIRRAISVLAGLLLKEPCQIESEHCFGGG